MSESGITETLYVCRSVNVFKIPPRPGGGHKSGTWLVEDKIFTGRLRLYASGNRCTIVLEDESGKEFASCPIPEGEREQAVEAVTDSSRYFVIRLMDLNNPRQKAFVGLGFDDRSEAFDFNVALSDHEKHVKRASATAAQRSSAASSGPQSSQYNTEAASLYQSRDLSLKEGQTIKINFKRPGSTSSGRTAPASELPKSAQMPSLAPPPLHKPSAPQPQSTGAAGGELSQSGSRSTAPATSGQQDSNLLELLGLDALSVDDVQKPAKPTQVTESSNWATF